MRVLIISENLSRGGKERRLVELIKGIRSFNSIECRLILLSRNIEYTEIYSTNIKLYLLERRTKKDIRIFFSIYKICKEYKPDIIHSWGSMPSVYCIPSVILLRPFFINAMISNAICKRFSENHIRSILTFPFSDFILANSKAGLKAYKVPLKKGIIIYNGFDLKRIEHLPAQKEIREKLDIKTPYIIGMVGAFHERKDYTSFIISANILLNQRSDVTFLAIGEGSLLNQMKQLVEEPHKDKIKFPGLIYDIESYINVFDIGILLTNPNVHEEGISNAILEYMALSKPVIATKGGGTGELIADDANGFLIEPLDVNTLVKKINLLLEDRQIRVKMGESGRNRVLEMFSISNMINQTVSLYQSVIKIHS
jgi:glycosyltransferase involved in cell wall biosynthesis